MPDLSSVTRGLPARSSRGRWTDYALFHLHKSWERLARTIRRSRRRRPHPRLLAAAVEEVRRAFPDPVCVETGCLRSADEGTESTLTIARALAGRGWFFTFELEPEHIETCRGVCGDLNRRIRYIEGDAGRNLARLRDEGALTTVHLAFLDSANDPDQIWREFRVLEPLMPRGSLLVVDDVIRPAVKGKRIKPYLHRSPAWETRVVHTWKGLLVAGRRA